jgi:hypothetical protein
LLSDDSLYKISPGSSPILFCPSLLHNEHAVNGN